MDQAFHSALLESNGRDVKFGGGYVRLTEIFYRFVADLRGCKRACESEILPLPTATWQNVITEKSNMRKIIDPAS